MPRYCRKTGLLGLVQASLPPDISKIEFSWKHFTGSAYILFKVFARASIWRMPFSQTSLALKLPRRRTPLFKKASKSGDGLRASATQGYRNLSIKRHLPRPRHQSSSSTMRMLTNTLPGSVDASRAIPSERVESLLLVNGAHRSSDLNHDHIIGALDPFAVQVGLGMMLNVPLLFRG